MLKELIISYVLLCNYSIYEDNNVLSDKINEYINKGYQPYGSPLDDRGTTCQAVVKYKQQE